MSIKALGEHYFAFSDFPVNIFRIHGNDLGQHPHDLTETPHHHDFSELVIIERGVGIHMVEGVNFPVRTGDVFLLQGDKKHCFLEHDDLQFTNIMFTPEALPLPWEQLKRIPGYNALFVLEPNYREKHSFQSRLQLDHKSMSEVQVLINAMRKEQLDNKPGYELLLLAWLLELMVMLARKYTTSDADSAKALLRIANVISALESDYSREWRLPELAKVASMSVNNLLLVFKEATGVTPIHYLLKLRMQKSMELLRTSKMTISEIAFAVGFTDSNYYSRQFRKLNGTSPRDYRQNLARA